MKTRKKFSIPALTFLWALSLISLNAFSIADNPGLIASGSSESKAGNYEVVATDQNFHYQGTAYEVYQVNYDDSSKDIQIAAFEGETCNSYIAFTKDFTIFYGCTREGFGAKQVMFATKDAQLRFNPNVYQEQNVLTKKRKLDTNEAIELIAATLPVMRQDY